MVVLRPQGRTLANSMLELRDEADLAAVAGGALGVVAPAAQVAGHLLPADDLAFDVSRDTGAGVRRERERPLLREVLVAADERELDLAAVGAGFRQVEVDPARL